AGLRRGPVPDRPPAASWTGQCAGNRQRAGAQFRWLSEVRLAKSPVSDSRHPPAPCTIPARAPREADGDDADDAPPGSTGSRPICPRSPRNRGPTDLYLRLGRADPLRFHGDSSGRDDGVWTCPGRVDTSDVGVSPLRPPPAARC